MMRKQLVWIFFLLMGVYFGLRVVDASAKERRQTVIRIVIDDDDLEKAEARVVDEQDGSEELKKVVVKKVASKKVVKKPVPQSRRKVASVATVPVPDESRLMEKLPAHEAQKWFLGNFRLQSLAALQKKSYSGSLEPSWNPEYRFNSHWAIGLNLGFAWFEEQTRENDFNTVEYQLFGSYRFGMTGWTLEAAAGFMSLMNAENWNGTYPIFSLNPMYRFNSPLWILDRLIIGSSALLYPGHFTTELKFGFGISF